MHHGWVLSGWPQRPVGGDIMTAKPILQGMAKRSSQREPAPPLLLSPPSGSSHEDHASSRSLRYPRSAGPGIKAAFRSRFGSTNQHDGYPLIVRRDGPTVRLYSRNAMTGRRNCQPLQLLPADQGQELHDSRRGGCAGARRLLFDELRRRDAAHAAILYASTSSSMTARIAFLDRRAALARLLRNTEAGILLNEHIAEDGPVVFAHACRLGTEGIVSKRVDGVYRSGP
jgi:hypothetical protein